MLEVDITMVCEVVLQAMEAMALEQLDLCE
jgi:hypothetical protein